MRPRRPLEKNLTRAQVLAYGMSIIIVNFQLRRSINAGRFCIERSAKMGFWGIFGGGAKIFGGNPPPPRNAMTADLRRSVSLQQVSELLVSIKSGQIGMILRKTLHSVWHQVFAKLDSRSG